MLEVLQKEIAPLQKRLLEHPIYKAVLTKEDLKTFMSHHIYAVWDFMSLVKFLQHNFAPSGSPWKPGKHHQVVHFINDIVLEEESDKTEDGRYMSHFEMYLEAMNEIGIETDLISNFVENFSFQNESTAHLPRFIRESLSNTFSFIKDHKPHIAASAFCFGRENIIPGMFQSLLDEMSITKEEAPIFHYYLSRHIHLDGELHGPMAIKMVEILCGEDTKKWEESIEAAKQAIKARINLWDGILEEIQTKSGTQVSTNISQQIHS